MTNLKLSKRLDKIASFVNNGSIIADIGCDHALLDIYLTINNICPKAYAFDIVDGALKQASINKDKYNAKNVIIKKSDGLCELKKDYNVDTIILSGLGNVKIESILNDNIEKLSNIKNIIIQSNTNVYNIRKYLVRIGYYIEDEVLIKDGKIIYTVISFKKGYKKYNNKELMFGPIILNNKDDLFKEEILSIINKNNYIINKLPKKSFVKILRLKIENKKLKEIIKRLM